MTLPAVAGGGADDPDKGQLFTLVAAADPGAGSSTMHLQMTTTATKLTLASCAGPASNSPGGAHAVIQSQRGAPTLIAAWQDVAGLSITSTPATAVTVMIVAVLDLQRSAVGSGDDTGQIVVDGAARAGRSSAGTTSTPRGATRWRRRRLRA